MRGNDLLLGTPDVMVTDTLTGNVLMKVFSAYSSGGDYETLGFGYGPGCGDGYDKIILILSRASGAPVAANALKFGAEVAKGKLKEIVNNEFAAARQAGLADLLKKEEKPAAAAEEEVVAPPTKVTEEEIPGIDILELEDAQRVVWKARYLRCHWNELHWPGDHSLPKKIWRRQPRSWSGRIYLRTFWGTLLGKTISTITAGALHRVPVFHSCIYGTRAADPPFLCTRAPQLSAST